MLVHGPAENVFGPNVDNYCSAYVYGIIHHGLMWKVHFSLKSNSRSPAAQYGNGIYTSVPNVESKFVRKAEFFHIRLKCNFHGRDVYSTLG